MTFKEGGPMVPFEVSMGPENRNEDGDMNTVPETEMVIDFARSGGPGGQNVNKRSTKAVLTWNVGESKAFSDEEKDTIRRELINRLNTKDEIVLSAQDERSQVQNKEAVMRRLQAMVVEALTPQKERKPTKPSRAERARRLDEKRAQGDKKRDRREPRGGW